MIDIDDSNFEEEVLKSEIPVFVDCYADWCSPCKALKPLLESIVEENAGKIKLAFLDIDSSHDLAVRFKISAIPKVIVFQNGEEITSISGLHSKKDYQEIIDNLE